MNSLLVSDSCLVGKPGVQNPSEHGKALRIQIVFRTPFKEHGTCGRELIIGIVVEDNDGYLRQGVKLDGQIVFGFNNGCVSSQFPLCLFHAIVFAGKIGGECLFHIMFEVFRQRTRIFKPPERDPFVRVR